MQRLEQYRRYLGFKPWAEFELEAMHRNIGIIQQGGLAYVSDQWYRRTGRTTKGLMTFLADVMDRQEGHLSVTQFVISPFGMSATYSLVMRCRALAACLGIEGLKIKEGHGGYEDHGQVFTFPWNYHLDSGVTHVWNAARPLTCLECLAVADA